MIATPARIDGDALCPRCLLRDGGVPDSGTAALGRPGTITLPADRLTPAYLGSDTVPALGWECDAHDRPVRVVADHRRLVEDEGGHFAAGDWVGALLFPDVGERTHAAVPVRALRDEGILSDEDPLDQGDQRATAGGEPA